MMTFVQQEKDWASYLFSKGSMIGLSEKLLHQYVEYIANRRMRVIGLEQKYEQSSANNPLPGLNIGLIVDHFKTHHKKLK